MLELRSIYRDAYHRKVRQTPQTGVVYYTNLPFLLHAWTGHWVWPGIYVVDVEIETRFVGSVEEHTRNTLRARPGAIPCDFEIDALGVVLRPVAGMVEVDDLVPEKVWTRKNIWRQSHSPAVVVVNEAV